MGVIYANHSRAISSFMGGNPISEDKNRVISPPNGYYPPKEVYSSYPPYLLPLLIIVLVFLSAILVAITTFILVKLYIKQVGI